jgi:hypothetical protein
MATLNYDEPWIAEQVKDDKRDAKATIIKWLDTRDDTVSADELHYALIYLDVELRAWCQAEQQQ